MLKPKPMHDLEAGPQANGDEAELRAPPDELAELARAAAGGNPDAASTLVMHLGGSMFTIVRRVLGHRHADLDDVAQDAVIALLGALPKFRNECGVAHFAHRIALLTALAALRRARVRLRWTDTSDRTPEERETKQEIDLELESLASPLATTVSTRRRALVRQLLDELPDVIAEALALHFILGYTVDEIAAAAAISPNTVWSRLRLGKQALRRKLEGDARLAELLEMRG
jgi:RNA polymerase sigma factor (sigma-70 family)